MGRDPRPEHMPDGDPCARCGHAAALHRVEHPPDGDPCKLCGLGAERHRFRTRDGRPQRPDTRTGRKRKTKSGPKKPEVFWGIDGEGQGRFPHRYTLLGAGDETGEQWEFIEGEITTERALDFILALPTRRVFAYSFQYDLTKILRNLPTKKLFLLFHEDLRKRRPKKGEDPEKLARLGPAPITFKPRKGKVYILNLQRSKFSVKDAASGKKVVVWDIWKFFQGKFTEALKNWQIGTPEELAEMASMKDQRAQFDKLDHREVRDYCRSEVHKMAQLARKLTDAHVAAGLKLTNYFGAGSTASAMLKAMNIGELRGPKPPPEMNEAVASAFFGGRFENLIAGSMPGPVWSYDISSAYPYELYFLPCMMHGRWRFTRFRKDLERCRAAIVNYSLGKCPWPHASWAPFPFRTDDGSITFPIESGGGWVYRDEYLAGERLFPHVQFRGAYILESDCVCRPFARIPEFYRERVSLGKEARGIVIKLGMNSCYGKLAQSLGDNPPFQSWVWAGMITSGTRAQILDALGRLSSHDQLLMVATDGIYTREPITFDPPRDTGTGDLPKPLGGWEGKEVPRGIFAARPGIYFPLQPTRDELKEIRARGIGKSVMHEAWSLMQEQYERGDKVARISIACRRCDGSGCDECEKGRTFPVRFMGVKSSTRRVCQLCESGCDRCDYRRADYYGEWLPRPLEISFNPLPKRARFAEDGVSLELRRIPKSWGPSTPYKRSIGAMAPEAINLRLADIEAAEQPDGGDYALY